MGFDIRGLAVGSPRTRRHHIPIVGCGSLSLLSPAPIELEPEVSQQRKQDDVKQPYAPAAGASRRGSMATAPKKQTPKEAAGEAAGHALQEGAATKPP